MRLAILADIHGNLTAFEAALSHLARQHADEVIIAGDIVVGSPDSAACWRRAQSLGCPTLRGNHERYVAHYGTAEASPTWSTEQYAPLHFALAQLPHADRVAMGNLPGTLRLPQAPDLLVVHASARSDYDTVAAHTPEDDLETMFAGAEERFIVRAHNHVAQVRLWGERVIVTAGSVGLPLDGNPTAQYLLLDRRQNGWHIQHQSVPYDLDAALARFRDTNYLAATGPIGRLFLREVATATHQLVPFFRWHARQPAGATVPLAEAVELFLNSY
jgi:predicted phosphodiesterase